MRRTIMSPFLLCVCQFMRRLELFLRWGMRAIHTKSWLLIPSINCHFNSQLTVRGNQPSMLSSMRLFKWHLCLQTTVLCVKPAVSLLYAHIKMLLPAAFPTHQCNKQQSSVLSAMCCTLKVLHFKGMPLFIFLITFTLPTQTTHSPLQRNLTIVCLSIKRVGALHVKKKAISLPYITIRLFFSLLLMFGLSIVFWGN